MFQFATSIPGTEGQASLGEDQSAVSLGAQNRRGKMFSKGDTSDTCVVCLDIIELYMISGWWFGTFFIFYNIWDNPSH